MGLEHADILAEDFQTAVCYSLARDKSVLDILSKLHMSAARMSLSISKAATTCGCISIGAAKQPQDNANSHIHGEICPACREHIEQEAGDLLYYLCALLSELDISLYDVILKQKYELNTLGRFCLR